MSGLDAIRAEFAASLGRGYPGALPALRRLRLSPRALFGSPALFGQAPIMGLGIGLYEPAEDGPAALICPIGEHYGDPSWPAIDDLVAFFPDQPGRWWLRRGDGVLLGQDHVEDVSGRSPVRLVSTPLQWLRADGEAACVLAWGADMRRHLHDRVTCDSSALARRLADRLAELCRPRIRIEVATHAA